MAVARFTKQAPCPVCGGHPDLPPGQGVRCTGFRTEDDWIHCTREEVSVGCKSHEGAAQTTYSHRGSGKCPCGSQHGADAYEPPRPRPRPQAQAQVKSIGDARGAEIVETYDYRDANGALLYQVCRMHPKSFRQRRPGPDGKWIWKTKDLVRTLYRIPELIAGLSAGDTVWIVEGEKDVEALMAATQVATCNTGGEGGWNPDFAGIFKKFGQPGGEIRIIQDIDPPLDTHGKPHLKGQKHARVVYESILAVLPEGMTLGIWEAAEGKDAADHLDAGRDVSEFRQVFPFPDNLLDVDPGRFKRHQIRAALDAPARVLDRIAQDHVPVKQPRCPTGLVGSQKLSHVEGVTVLAGSASAGKSYFAISTAIAACNAGWEVFYLSCEMHEDLVFDRAVRAAAGATLTTHDWTNQGAKNTALVRSRSIRLPEQFNLLNVDAGVTIEAVVEMLAETVSHRHTLVILDSLSSFVDCLDDSDRNDPFKMASLRDVVKLATGVRRMTHGRVAWLLLSELNKEGKAKGRFVEHRSDVGLAMESNPDVGHLKRVRITKNWRGPTGDLGDFILEWELAHLRNPEPEVPQPSLYTDDTDDTI